MRSQRYFSDRIRDLIGQSIDVKAALGAAHIAAIERAARAIVASLNKGGTLVVFGNGGSAADSQHIAAELVGRFQRERRALRAVALTTNTSTLTALANDYGYDASFARQLEAVGRRGDVALAISTSGNAANVAAAVKKAASRGMVTVGLTGGGGGMLAKLADISIVVPSKNTARIQEAHIMIGHILCDLIEEACA